MSRSANLKITSVLETFTGEAEKWPIFKSRFVAYLKSHSLVLRHAISSKGMFETMSYDSRADDLPLGKYLKLKGETLTKIPNDDAKGYDNFSEATKHIARDYLHQRKFNRASNMIYTLLSTCVTDKILINILGSTRTNAPDIEENCNGIALWEALIAHFEDSSDIALANTSLELLNLSMTKGIDNYAYDFTDKLARLRAADIKLPTSFIKAIFLNGLPKKYTSLKHTLIASNIKNTQIHEIVSKVKLIDSMEKDKNGNTEAQAFNAEREGKPAKHKPKFPCLNCQSLQHYTKKCPKPCGFCRKGGHTINNCRQKISQDAIKRYKEENEQKALFSSDFLKETKVYLDSGATDHFITNIPNSHLTTLTDIKPGRVRDAAGERHQFSKTATFGMIKGAKVVPSFQHSLISTSKLISDTGSNIRLTNTGAYLGDTQIAIKEDNLYRLTTFDTKPSRAMHANYSEQNMLLTLHNRLCHASYTTIIKGIVDKRIKTKLQNKTLAQLNKMALKAPICKACGCGKTTNKVKSATIAKATKFLHTIHIDLIGPITPQSRTKNHIMIIIDSYSGYTWVYPLRFKSDATEAFKQFISQQTAEIHTIVTDGAKELTFKDIREEYNISKHIITPPYHSTQNKAERYARTVQERARCSMIHMNAPKNFWTFAFSTAAYSMNRTPSRSNPNNKSPFEMRYGKPPNLKHLRTFFSPCFVKHEHTPRGHKMHNRGELAYFLGYPKGERGYTVLINNRIYIRHSVYFCENMDKNRHLLYQQHTPTPANRIAIPIAMDLETDNYRPAMPPSDMGPDNYSPHVEENPDPPQPPQPPRRSPLPPRRSTRITATPWRYMPGQALMGSRYVKQVPASDIYCPSTLKEALTCEDKAHWEESLQAEHKALNDKKVYSIVDKPKQCSNLMSLKHVFTVKQDSLGNFTRRKTRICARGYTQQHNIDYEETFSPTIKKSSLRLFLSIVNQMDMEAVQFDISSAFLCAPIEDHLQLYVKPPGYMNLPDHKVLRLHKALYGTKQGARRWNETFTGKLKRIGFTQLKTDPCIYLKTDKHGHTTLIATHVDDGICASTSKLAIKQTLDSIEKDFPMGEREPLHYYLGIKIHRDRKKHTLSIDQSVYIQQLVTKFKADLLPPKNLPSNSTSKNLLRTSDDPMTSHPYQSLVGGFIYISDCSRPDITFTVNRLARFMSKPTDKHWSVARNLLQYLAATKDKRITFRRVTHKEYKLHSFHDSDYAACVDTRRSTTGMLTYMGGSLINWQSKLQPTIALSTVEAEYMAGLHAAKDLLCFKNIIGEMKLPIGNPPLVMRTDNQGSINASKNPIQNSRLKHIDIKHMWIRDHVAKGTIVIKKVNTKDNPADLLTKFPTSQTYNTLSPLLIS